MNPIQRTKNCSKINTVVKYLPYNIVQNYIYPYLKITSPTPQYNKTKAPDFIFYPQASKKLYKPLENYHETLLSATQAMRSARSTTTWSWTTGRRRAKLSCRRCRTATSSCCRPSARTSSDRVSSRRPSAQPRPCCSSPRATIRASRVSLVSFIFWKKWCGKGVGRGRFPGD